MSRIQGFSLHLKGGHRTGRREGHMLFKIPRTTISIPISLSFMAAKPHRFRQFADSSLNTPAKKARTICSSIDSDDSSASTMKEAFSSYTQYLNNLNDKRERVVKASRDITINSKKVIFQVHRISKNNKVEVLEKAEKDLAAVKDQYIARLVKELQGADFWKLRRAYSPGVQEYVEAATLFTFCKTGNLLKLDEMNDTILPLNDPSKEPLQINILDYILGMADLTGELMRLAMGRISDGEIEFAEKICEFVREIYRKLTILAPLMDDSSDMQKKMEVMLQSVMKIENACFSVHVRGSEYIPFIESADSSCSHVGASDFDQ